ncbi:hypothetical protein AUEXF2481DRAFT_34539 [Aureobasidium subglaciale EXF-2481]|uniref:BRCT domain-containing protein n=1 Tax=Aureobasidium subglaciale (strain EXF-2481) TaxID=1043005 RepID=A0A074Z1Y2_AURSE|nr:uncharacterized protein AUEXF2481DRAFT_34539 [Aureobasidium subglaciale EXF-2481]KAI5212114.1 hypothetical protein E4T38_00640 [Aureobasidium subglaciale]KAI5231173.1 hypothetical protein E4T40_00641 [Aureobasidium subglaciale]KAI5234187.1 hypothetical protein E4T41_00639 [Aureobasidium subglaciale]KAI5267634.1 hypothetical protein E4T46_00639 [Aureobasidium subglaciale]KER00343.1 hypothetical protein AUEXF2481DRAFT_34539 [Aureobasidium subglaciale EXF-2481]
MLVSLTVGKVDAGVAVLLTEDKRLIEFPSILLPADITSGSIVDINVARNEGAEETAFQKFEALQEDIYSTFGIHSPCAPVLRCRNATQTSVVLEWDPVQLATAELRSLSLYRNGSKAGNIPRDKLSTKISGLAVDSEYTFHLVLRTSAGTYTSERLTVRTHKMTDLTGITITPGIMPQQLRDDLQATVDRIGAKMIDTLRIDTTHFVCTEGRGQAWEKAGDMNVPVVVPDWLKGCEREGRIVGVRAYYLDADPKLRNIGPSSQPLPSPNVQQDPRRPSTQSQPSQQHLQLQQQQLRVHPPLSSPRIEHTPPTPEQTKRPEIPTSEPSPVPAPPPKDDSVDTAPPTPPKEETSSEPEQKSAPISDLPFRNLPSNAEEQQPEESAIEETVGEAPAPAEEASTLPETTSEAGEKPTESPKVNNLKAIGIPHEEVSSTKAPTEFDDVAL